MHPTTLQLLKQAIIYLIVFSSLAIISILWVDKPSAYFFAKYTMGWHWPNLISENICPFIAIVTVIAILIRYRKILVQGILTASYFYLAIYNIV